MPDIVLSGLVILSALVGFFRGILKELLTIAAWVAAAVGAVFGARPLGGLFLGAIPSPWIAQSLAGALIFIAILLLSLMFTRRWSAALKNTRANGPDRMFGLLFGVARGLLVLAVAWLLFSFLVPPALHPNWIHTMRLLPMVETVADMLRPLLPDTTRPLSEEGGEHGNTPGGSPAHPETLAASPNPADALQRLASQ